MTQVFLEGRGPFERDPYFTEAREELSKMAREVPSLADNPLHRSKGAGYLIAALSQWKLHNWDVYKTVCATQEDENILETVISSLSDHLIIIINGSNVINSDKFKINLQIENDGFTLITDQIEYYKNKSEEFAGGQRKITKKYQILLPYNWCMMQGGLSNEGIIYLKVPQLCKC